MSNKLKLSCAFVTLSSLLCYFTYHAIAAVVTSIVFAGFVVWVEKFSQDHDKDLADKLKHLEDRVNNLSLQKSLHR
ncbi:MAG: hypothetical protein H0X02_01905 [Nitrosomonas sp.]|nr:hypothetical protein [Nitrosomonas sp.]